MAQLSSPLLLTEIAHPQHRGKVTAVYNCLWNGGAIVNTWLVRPSDARVVARPADNVQTFGTKNINSDWSWRIPTLIQGGPSIIQLCFIWWVPESPRWLISKDRADEALAMLGKYHANGNVNHPTVQFEYAEIKETLRIEFQASMFVLGVLCGWGLTLRRENDFLPRLSQDTRQPLPASADHVARALLSVERQRVDLVLCA